MADTPNTSNASLLTEQEYDLLVWLEQYYLLNGALPTNDEAEQQGIDKVLYVGALKKDLFISALLDRGVPARLFRDAPVGLSEEQLLVVNSLLDLTDNRSRRKKLAEAGVPTQKFESWLRDPVFSKYLTERSEALLSSGQHEANLALMDRVRAGEMNAIKYFNEMSGRFVQASRSGTSAFDSKLLIIRMVEVLQIHLADQPELLQRIAQDLLQLSEGDIGTPTMIRPPTVKVTKEEPKKLEPVVGTIVKSHVPSVGSAL